jgi:cytochrome c2
MCRLFLALSLFLLLAACEQKIPKDTESAVEVGSNNETLIPSSDPAKGKVVYYANCTSCHNYNPKKPGSIGPEVYGSSIELLTKKILYGKYPENYQAKRTSGIMPLLPHLNQQISNIHAFLNLPSK